MMIITSQYVQDASATMTSNSLCLIVRQTVLTRLVGRNQLIKVNLWDCSQFILDTSFNIHKSSTSVIET